MLVRWMFFLALVILNTGSCIAGDDEVLFGVGSRLHYNVTGDFYDDSMSLYGIVDYSDFEVSIGTKKDDGKHVFDGSISYNVYSKGPWNVKLGGGVENSSPTIDYIMSYEVTDAFFADFGFSQILSESYDSNLTEVFFGFSVKFPEPIVEQHEEVNDSYSRDANEVNHSLRPVVTNDVQVDVSGGEDIPMPYIVKTGEWLLKLQRQYHFEMSEVIKINAISNPDLIYPGQRLWFKKN
ncbi:LysM peptidoglycan-binding domain-containing protein [Vibrio campbellii]|uniref:LysM peptidoglycan-binding domain-containing protein n=1 Tax=Vibrio campbellii TaxID=680 RepID=UPI000680F892|nr:LysM domain-containing protein [Vibrio campbellii]